MSALAPVLEPTLVLRSADPLIHSADSLTPLESALTGCCFSYKQNAPLSPLESALTNPSYLHDSTHFKTLCFDTLSDHSLVTPLESALTKNTGGGVGGTPCSRCYVRSERFRLGSGEGDPYR